jgi:glycosyltransferase involved in cell wall biosynthesis
VNHKPSISVIIPTYNRADLVAEAIQSVLAQTGADYEIIVVDDGSTDETLSVLAGFGTRIRYLREPHTGLPGRVRNTGIRAAHGDYIAFLDSDDLWVAGALAPRLDFLQRHHHLSMVYADSQLFSHELIAPASGWIGPRLLSGDCIQTSTVVVRRRVLEDVGLFAGAPELRWGEDWDLWLRIAARYEIGLIAEPLARSRMHAGSLSAQQDVVTRCHRHLCILERARAFAPSVYASTFHQALSLHFCNGISALLDQGRPDDARTLLTEAVRYDAGALRGFLDLLRLPPATPPAETS